MQDKLNAIVKDIFTQIEADLNKWSIPYGEEQPGYGYNVPFIKTLGGGQVIKDSSGSFALAPPTTGVIQSKLVPLVERETILIRRLVGSQFVSRIVENPDKVRSFLLPLVTEMILSLEKNKSFPKTTLNMGTYGQFQRPGSAPGVYFTTMWDDPYSYELRLFSNSVSLVDIS
jgi:hypothetical protein